MPVFGVARTVLDRCTQTHVAQLFTGNRIVKSILLAVVLATIASFARAGALAVPLQVEVRHLHVLVANALDLDAHGAGSLAADPCNRLELGDLQLAPGQRSLELSLSLEARTGVLAFGRCTGPPAFFGRFQLELHPRVSIDGRALVFEPVAAELRRPDGGAGPLTRTASSLASRLIVPRLSAIRFDVTSSLAEIDTLVEAFLPATADGLSPLADRARLTAVEMSVAGLDAVLTISLNARPRDPVPNPEPPLDEAELAAWQRIEDELDGFLTVTIVGLADRLDDRDLQLDLLGVLIDSRQRIGESLAADTDGDPTEALFLNAWEALRPLLGRLGGSDLGDDVDRRLAGFVSAGDALMAVQALGPEYGLEVSRDGLRRLARLLLADEAPSSLTPLPLAVDPTLQRLFGMGEAPITTVDTRTGWLDWLIAPAHASVASPAEPLRGLVPYLATLDDYLQLVEVLLAHEIRGHLSENHRMDEAHRNLFGPLVRATAWKESCWRHYVGRAGEPEVIRSPVGAVGMMQIMGRVWRGVYDIDRLESDVQYNVAAGIRILEHYLVDYAVRRREHEQPGGIDNLVRATYAAYNGGPSHLSRHRREDTPARLQAIDREFWRHYEHMKHEQWPDVASCYAVRD